MFQNDRKHYQFFVYSLVSNVVNFNNAYTVGPKIIGPPRKFRKRQRFLQAKKVLLLI